MNNTIFLNHIVRWTFIKKKLIKYIRKNRKSKIQKKLNIESNNLDNIILSNNYKLGIPNINNPVHILPYHLIKLDISKQLLLTEKADGIPNKSINTNILFPDFPEELKKYHIEGEYIKHNNIYFIYEIHTNNQIDNYNHINHLRKIHPFINDDINNHI